MHEISTYNSIRKLLICPFTTTTRIRRNFHLLATGNVARDPWFQPTPRARSTGRRALAQGLTPSNYMYYYNIIQLYYPLVLRLGLLYSTFLASFSSQLPLRWHCSIQKCKEIPNICRKYKKYRRLQSWGRPGGVK